MLEDTCCRSWRSSSDTAQFNFSSQWLFNRVQTQDTTTPDSVIDMCSWSILTADEVGLPISYIMCMLRHVSGWNDVCYPWSGPQLWKTFYFWLLKHSVFSKTKHKKMKWCLLSLWNKDTEVWGTLWFLKISNNWSPLVTEQTKLNTKHCKSRAPNGYT